MGCAANLLASFFVILFSDDCRNILGVCIFCTCMVHMYIGLFNDYKQTCIFLLSSFKPKLWALISSDYSTCRLCTSNEYEQTKLSLHLY